MVAFISGKIIPEFGIDRSFRFENRASEYLVEFLHACFGRDRRDIHRYRSSSGTGEFYAGHGRAGDHHDLPAGRQFERINRCVSRMRLFQIPEFIEPINDADKTADNGTIPDKSSA